MELLLSGVTLTVCNSFIFNCKGRTKMKALIPVLPIPPSPAPNCFPFIATILHLPFCTEQSHPSFIHYKAAPPGLLESRCVHYHVARNQVDLDLFSFIPRLFPGYLFSARLYRDTNVHGIQRAGEKTCCD